MDATLQLESPLLSTAPTSLVRVASWRRQQAGIRRDYPSSAALSGSLGGKWNSMPLRYSCEQVRSHQAVMLGKVRRHVFDAFRQWPGLDHHLDAVRRGRVTTIAVWAALVA